VLVRVLRRHVLVARMLAAACEVGVEVVGPDEVFDVEERRPLLPDVDERRLKAGEHTRHLAQVHVADGAGCRIAFSLDVELGDDAVFDESDARFAYVAANDEYVLLGHFGQEPSRPARNASRLTSVALPDPSTRPWTSNP